jgi:predicted RNase H-like HicB family nuclease
MTRTFTASVTVEDGWFVAQCLEVDVASQGMSEQEAVAHLKEALELYFDPPTATAMPRIVPVEIEISAA